MYILYPDHANWFMGDDPFTIDFWVYSNKEAKSLSEIKKKRDTGGGCSVCGSNPAVNIEGTYWLCGR